MHPVLLRLADGPSPGTLGHAREVADEIAADPDLFAVVVDGLADDAEGVRNRSAIAIDRATERRPDLLAPHADALFDAAEADRSGGALRRLLPRLLSRLALDPDQARRLAAHAEAWLRTEPPGAQANALDALAAVALQHPDLAPALRPLLEDALDHDAPSVRSRARRHGARLDRAETRDAEG